MTRLQMRKKLIRWDDAYADGKPLVSDERYDKLRRKFAKLYPNDKFLQRANTANEPGAKVKLHAVMGKMEKCRPSTVQQWLKSRPSDTFMLEPKLDGIAIRLKYVDGRRVEGYKRGDGVIGRDVSHLIPFINGSVPRIPVKGTWYVDCEAIIHRSIYNAKHKDKGEYSNCRAFVAGVMNSKVATPEVKKLLADITLIAHNVHPDNKKLYENQFNKLMDLGKWNFITVLNPVRWSDDTFQRALKGNISKCYRTGLVQLGKFFLPTNEITEALCKHYLSYWQKVIDIDQDGLVLVHSNVRHQEKLGYDGLFPQFAIAVKPEIADQKTLVGVIKHVELNISGRGIYKPTGVLEKPLHLGGVMVTRCTLHNMRTVIDNGIGPGAKVKMIRSGDVIPRFIETVKSATVIVPKKCVHCKAPLKWTKTDTDLYCDNVNCNGFLKERVITFFNKFKVDSLKEGTVKKLMIAGYDTVPKILQISPEKLATIEGMGKVSAAKICKAIMVKLGKVSLAQLMSASGIFQTKTTGLSDKRFEPIIKKFGKKMLLDGNLPDNFELKLLEIEGIGNILAETFVENLPVFREFYKSLPSIEFEKNAAVKRGKFTGKVFAWTKYRDATEETYVIENGGTVGGVTKKTFALFAGDMSSGKLTKARALGVKIIPRAQAMKWLQSQ